MLTIHGLHKAYDDRTILQIDALTLPNGVHWVQGENGAGKTTLFRCLAGVLPCEGMVELDKQFQPKKQAREYRLRVNLGEAEPLYPEFLTGTDLLLAVAEAKQAPNGQLESLCESLGVGNYRHNRVGTYSSGMLKKLSLVMALLGQPRWVLLDEPLITLDPDAQAALLQLLAQGHQAGVNYLLSSHQAWSTQLLPTDSIYQLAHQTLHKA